MGIHDFYLYSVYTIRRFSQVYCHFNKTISNETEQQKKKNDDDDDKT